MNELATTKQNILMKPNVLQEVEDDLLKIIDDSILTCYYELNMTVPNQAERTVLANKVLDSVLERFTSMRAQEIPVAFRNGIRREYGEFYGLCVVSFEQFIKGYLESPDRKKLVEEKNRLAFEPTKEPTPDEKFDTAKQLSVDAYNLVKAGKPIGLTATACYVFINSLGLIGYDYKKGSMKESLQIMLEEKERDIVNSTELLRRRHMNAELTLLRENLAKDEITPAQHEEWKRAAKRFVITNWMRDMVMDDVDMGQLIESKRDFYKTKP